jgi:hypothetical protein
MKGGVMQQNSDSQTDTGVQGAETVKGQPKPEDRVRQKNRERELPEAEERED